MMFEETRTHENERSEEYKQKLSTTRTQGLLHVLAYECKCLSMF